MESKRFTMTRSEKGQERNRKHLSIQINVNRSTIFFLSKCVNFTPFGLVNVRFDWKIGFIWIVWSWTVTLLSVFTWISCTKNTCEYRRRSQLIHCCLEYTRINDASCLFFYSVKFANRVSNFTRWILSIFIVENTPNDICSFCLHRAS